ncbi:MAG: thioredoxin domain-containing protein [Planctomycetota bacterium]
MAVELPLQFMALPVDAVRTTLFLLLSALTCGAQEPPEEDAAYLNVSRARDAAARKGGEDSLLEFERSARAFLQAHPESRRCSSIHLWLGDLLGEMRPREAHREYLLARDVRGRRRATQLSFRHEVPPPLDASHWIGQPVEPDRITGEVKVLIFLTLSHPQTRKLLPHLERLQARYGNEGLRMAGIAVTTDDGLAGIQGRLRELKLPFPVAIDRPQSGKRSSSLVRYHGGFLPWAVVIDRYGRIAWLGGLKPAANALTRLEMKLIRLVAAPTYAGLAKRVRSGDRVALESLATIRTKETANVLAEALKAGLPDAIRKRVLEVLADLLPEEYLDGETDAALRRWEREREGHRFSFAANRLVRRR